MRAARRLRVLHVIPAVAPRYGGPSEAVIRTCQALRDAGVETSIVTTDADGDRCLAVPHDACTDYRGVCTRFFPRQWSEAFKYSRPLARWLTGHAGEFDVIHIHAVFSHASLAAATAARRAGVPYIVRPLGSLSPWGLRQRRLLKRLLWRGSVGKMLRGAHAIHCTSSSEKRDADAAAGGAPGVVIPLGVDLPAAGLPGDGGPREGLAAGIGSRPYVLVLGRLHPVKGLDLLVPAFLDLVEQRPFSDWRLVIAGDGDPACVARLQGMLRTLTERDRVLLTGWVAGETKAALLRNAALLAMPSHQENFGLAAFEALAQGVPVLVSSSIDLATGIREANAGWVAELTPADLKRALGEALSDARERAARGLRGRSLVASRYTWPAVAERLQALYQQVSAARGLREHARA